MKIIILISMLLALLVQLCSAQYEFMRGMNRGWMQGNRGRDNSGENRYGTGQEYDTGRGYDTGGRGYDMGQRYQPMNIF